LLYKIEIEWIEKYYSNYLFLLTECKAKVQTYSELEIKKALKNQGFMLREEGSNLRPLGYEPNELPLLYPTMQYYDFFGALPNVLR
jgi:hypothetical protein